MKKNEILQGIIKPVVEGLGYQFWGLEYQPRGPQSLLRIYIDSEEGITVDDCAKVSRQLASVLDVENPISSEYTLEVSSPGLDRPLFTEEQYLAYIGARIQVRLKVPLTGRRKFDGMLAGVEDAEVIIRCGEEEFLFPLELVEKAAIIPTFEDRQGD